MSALRVALHYEHTRQLVSIVAIGVACIRPVTLSFRLMIFFVAILSNIVQCCVLRVEIGFPNVSYLTTKYLLICKIETSRKDDVLKVCDPFFLQGKTSFSQRGPEKSRIGRFGYNV